MPLHNRRRRLAELAEQEAAGELFWTSKFSERTRTRLEFLMTGLSESAHRYAESAQRLILQDEGVRFLSNPNNHPARDYFAYLGGCPDDMMPTVLEAMNEAFEDREVFDSTFGTISRDYIDGVNEILREERVAWEFIGDEMTPFSSRELHVEVVEPTLRLLATAGWERVEAAYQGALRELSAGNAPDAVTDAGTALQEALTKMGAEGNALGPLITSAQRKGIILGHDRALFETAARAATWVSADRSQVGDAHSVSAADREDAWLSVHVVGAILLRLSAQTNRPA